MNKSITQDAQNDNQISKTIRRFFTRFHVTSALKSANAYKNKGIPVVEIFQYLFILIFSNRSMYMNLLTERNIPAFGKDTVYRFMKMIQINWIRFTTVLSSTFLPVNSVLLSSENKKNRINEASAMDKRTVGYKRRQMSVQKGTSVMLELLKQAKNAVIPAKYVLFDSWFSSPSSSHAIKEIGYDIFYPSWLMS